MHALDRLRVLLTGFQRFATRDGVALRSPRGSTILLEEHAPLRPLRAIVDELCGGRERSFGPLERFTTEEGEHAGLVTVTFATPRSRLTVALVAAEVTATQIVATSRAAEDDALVEEAARLLARWSFLGLSERRRRRFAYRPPSGWNGVARPHVTDWLAPECPRDPTVIHVFDARRRPGGSEEIDRAVTMQSRSMVALPGDLAVIAAPGLRGFVRLHTGGEGGATTLAEAVLGDTRYDYVVHLVTPTVRAQERLPILLELLWSIEAAPQARAEESPVSTIWAE